MRQFTVSEILTKEQLQKAASLKTAAAIKELIIIPNLATIEQILGDKADPMYLSYCVEHALVECLNYQPIQTMEKADGQLPAHHTV